MQPILDKFPEDAFHLARAYHHILVKGIECLDVEILSWNEDSQMITYKITGTPVCQYDQHSRARVGIKFKDYKVSEEPNYVVYTQVWETMEKDPEFKKEV